MRYNMDGHNNGAICDMCGTKMLPNEVIKMTFLKKVKEDSTGRYDTLQRQDLCHDCYSKINLMFGFGMKKSR